MKSNLNILSILIVLTILVMSFGSLIVSADTSTDLVDNFSTYGTENWIGYDSYANMRYNTENANTVFGTLPTRIYGPDWNDNIYLAYNGNFGGKMFEAYFYCDDWYVNENLVNAFPNVERWSAYYELYSLMLSNCIEIYAGSTYTNMSKVNVDYVLGGKTPANGRLACSVVVETLPSDTQFVKLQLKSTSWVPRWGGVKITDDRSDLTTYSCTPANGGTATPTPQPTASSVPNNTPDPSVILYDELNDFSHVYSHENLGIFTQRSAVSSSLYPEHQDLNNPYVTSVARRDGVNSNLVASLAYDLGEINASTTTVSVGVLYNYGGTYAGGQPVTDTSLDNLNRLLGYIQLKIYESADGQNFTENNSAVLTKYPGPWMGQSMHYVVYSIKGLTEGTKYVKFVIPDIQGVSVELAGWDSMLDYVKVIDKSQGSGTTVVTDNLDDKNIMLEMSSNMIIAQQSVVVSSELYPDHQDLNNPYKSNMARRDGSESEKEGYLIYKLDEVNDTTTINVDSFYLFNYGYAGADPQTDSALDHLNKLLEYTQFKFYESSDGVNYTEATNVSLRKIPGPWGGQSMHYVNYTIKGLSANSIRFKIVIPSVEAANANGVGLYGWEPFIDSVKFTTTYNSGGVTTDTKLSLSNIYMSDMILQANAPVVITGTAAKDKTVTATFSDGVNEYTKSAVADANEEFSITFDGFDPGYTYYTLQVTDGTTTKSFANILFGDVFLATGQSNVRWYLENYWFTSGDNSSANDITNANFEFFKVMTVDEQTAPVPSDTTAIGKSWYSVNSSTAGETGAYLFYLGRQLLADKNYPIGIVDAAWGGQSIGGFMPNGTIYNSHIYPFRNMKFKACLWWQGESDSYNATAYAAKQIKLIDGYRELFGEDLPFVYIQLENFERSGYNYLYSTIRPEQNAVYKHYLEQAQGEAKKSSVGMVSVIDMMPETHDNDHPEGKKYVAERTIKCLNSIAYGIYDEFSGPLFSSAVKHDGEIDITFSHITGGLATTDGGITVNCFKLTDALGTKTNVTGTIDGNRIVIRTNIDAVSVEYATDNYNYNANLKNGFGFVAPAFETQAITDRGITGYTLTNNTLSSVRLTDAECESGKLVAAVYDDYKLTGIKTISISAGDYISSTAEIPINISTLGGNYLKLFFVDSFGNIKPLTSDLDIGYLN